MSALLAALDALCLFALAGFAFFILARDVRSRLNQYFALLALALTAWVASLFAFDLQITGAALLWLGRFNFAAIVFAVTLAYLFVREVAGGPNRPALRWLWAETALLGAVTLLTPLVDRQELVRAGVHVTVYGPLFLPYVLHALALLAAALRVAFRTPEGMPAQTRGRLRLIGGGVVATGAVALVTNALLPYAFGDFRFIHVGTVSTLLFLTAVGYAVFLYHLFDVRLVVRAAFVYAGLLALALELYQLALSWLARLVPLGSADDRHFAATAAVLVVNAFTQGPVKRWLGRLIDRAAGRRRTSGGHRPGTREPSAWRRAGRSSGLPSASDAH